MPSPELDAFLDAATTLQIGNLGEEAARSFLESVRDEVIVELDDAGLPRSRGKRGIDIVAIDRGALVAYEVKARLRSGRRTRSGDLVRPRLTRSAGFRQASQHYVLERLGDVLDEIDDETAVDVHVLVIDLHDRVLQQFGVDDEGRVDAAENSWLSDGTYHGGRMEPEGAAIVTADRGAASLLVGVVNGGSWPAVGPKVARTFHYRSSRVERAGRP